MESINISTSKLTRSDTNDSTSGESLFSRKTSSSSLMSPNVWKSATKLNQLCDLKELDFKMEKIRLTDDDQHHHQQIKANDAISDVAGDELSAINIDALKLALSKIKSNNEDTILQAPLDPLHALTTTPQEEVIYSKWCVILVGLPASGKSSIVNHLLSKVTEELPMLKADTFNAGNFRRNLTTLHQSANFFDFNNKEAKKQRDLFASLALDHLLNSLINDSLDIGIFDATNSTVERREKIIKSIEEKEALSHGNVRIHKVILHVQIDDEILLNYNIEGKTTNQDYNDQNHDVAKTDFIKRLNMYRSAFEDITKKELDHYNCMYLGVKNAKEIEIYEPNQENVEEQENEEEEEEEEILSDDVTIKGLDDSTTISQYHDDAQHQGEGKSAYSPLHFDHQRHSLQDTIDHSDPIYVELVNFVQSYYREYGRCYYETVTKSVQSKTV